MHMHKEIPHTHQTMNTTCTYTTQINTHRTQTPHKDHTQINTQIHHRYTDLYISRGSKTHHRDTPQKYTQSPYSYIQYIHTNTLQVYRQTTDTHAVHTQYQKFSIRFCFFLSIYYILVSIQFPAYSLSHSCLTSCCWSLLCRNPSQTGNASLFLPFPRTTTNIKTVAINEKGHYTMSKHSKWVKIED